MILHLINIYFEVVFVDLGSRYFMPLENTFRREVLFTMSWPVELYMIEEQLQSGIFRLEVVNIKIMQQVYIIEKFSCNYWFDIGNRNDRQTDL